MKISYTSLLSLLLVSGSSAFAPKSVVSFGVANKNVVLSAKQPFFADSSAPEEATPEAAPAEISLEDEVNAEVQEEMKKKKVISNLRNANGVDYAPWMNISADDEAKIRQVVKERAEARRKRQEQETKVSGALLADSQAQELSGGGLRSKVIDQDVELEWATSTETNTKGFLVKRRPAKTEDFEVIATYEDWGPLASQGKEGGVYRYLDTSLPSAGGWVYRVTECENNGRESDICQCLVEVQTAEEQRGAVIAAVSIGVLMVGALVAGVLLDPVGGY